MMKATVLAEEKLTGSHENVKKLVSEGAIISCTPHPIPVIIQFTSTFANWFILTDAVIDSRTMNNSWCCFDKCMLWKQYHMFLTICCDDPSHLWPSFCHHWHDNINKTSTLTRTFSCRQRTSVAKYFLFRSNNGFVHDRYVFLSS